MTGTAKLTEADRGGTTVFLKSVPAPPSESRERTLDQ